MESISNHNKNDACENIINIMNYCQILRLSSLFLNTLHT